MIERSSPLAAQLNSRLGSQIWAIEPSAHQAYVGDMLAGRMALLEVRPREQSATYEKQGAIAVFRVEGVMVPNAQWYDECSTTALSAALSLAARDEDIKAGVMVINTPGGMALGQLEVSAAARAFATAKPLTAHIAGRCCSAGYWLAAQATHVYAGPRDDVGSIGVRSLLYDFSKYFAEVGVEAVSSATGPLKDLGVMGTEVSAEQRQYLQDRVDYLFEDFKAAVMTGRGMDEKQFAAVADGRVWFGEQAVDLGLVDGTQSMEKTFAGVESALNPSVKENLVMAENATTEPAAPKAATTSELKKTFPNSSAEWREEQTELGATMADAAVAYAQFQEKKAEKAEAEAAEAKAEAEKAEAERQKGKTESTKSQRGVESQSSKPGEESESDQDYRVMAQDYMAKHNCRWSEACLVIKRRHPEAVGQFGGPDRS